MSDTLERFQPPEEIRQALWGSEQEFFNAAWELATRYKEVGRSQEAVEYYFVAAALMERRGQNPRDVYTTILQLDPDNALAASRLDPDSGQQSRAALFVQHVLSRHPWEQVQSALNDERARNWVTPPRGDQRSCPDCGMGVPPGATQCEMCGAELAARSAVPEPQAPAGAPPAAVPEPQAPAGAPPAAAPGPQAPAGAPPAAAPEPQATAAAAVPAPEATATAQQGTAPAVVAVPAKPEATPAVIAVPAKPEATPAVIAVPTKAKAPPADAQAEPEPDPKAPWAGYKRRKTAEYGVLTVDSDSQDEEKPERADSAAQSGAHKEQVAGAAAGPGLVQLGPDGNEAGWFPFSGGRMVVGSEEETFATQHEDAGLEAQHASIAWDGEFFDVRDLGSRTGVYLKVQGEAALDPGQLFQAGSHSFQLEGPPAGQTGFKVVHLGLDGSAVAAYQVSARQYNIGRRGNDLDLPHDPYLSDSHVKVGCDDRGFTVEDLESEWGTFLRLPAEVQLPRGTILRVGRLLFRLDLR